VGVFEVTPAVASPCAGTIHQARMEISTLLTVLYTASEIFLMAVLLHHARQGVCS
jgi:hypothetical protein